MWHELLSKACSKVSAIPAFSSLTAVDIGNASSFYYRSVRIDNNKINVALSHAESGSIFSFSINDQLVTVLK